MLLALDRDRSETLSWEETLELPESLFENGALVELSPVQCRGELLCISSGFLLHADLHYEQALECTRCLGPLRLPTECAIELLVVPEEPEVAIEESSEEEVELESDDLDILRTTEDEIDTKPLVVEQVQLQVPMKPLCREECRGLCPRCGADRNETPDCCPENGYDARWSGLEALRDRLQEPGA